MLSSLLVPLNSPKANPNVSTKGVRVENLSNTTFAEIVDRQFMAFLKFWLVLNWLCADCRTLLRSFVLVDWMIILIINRRMSSLRRVSCLGLSRSRALLSTLPCLENDDLKSVFNCLCDSSL
jgi:hypothetical protein